MKKEKKRKIHKIKHKKITTLKIGKRKTTIKLPQANIKRKRRGGKGKNKTKEKCWGMN